MSKTAGTSPTKRSVYREPPSRDPPHGGHVQHKQTIYTGRQNARSRTNHADVMKIKHKTQNEDADPTDKHFDTIQETWMTKSEIASNKPSRPIINKNTGSMSRTSNGYTKKNPIPQDSNILAKKDRNTKPNNNKAEERSDILKQNEQYTQRISELEQETARVLAEYAKLNEEYERLSRTLEAGSQQVKEPYSRVLQDRRILRDAEIGYKKIIRTLEIEGNEKQSEINKLQDELKRLKARFKPNMETQLETMKQNEKKMQKEIRKLQNDNASLRKQLDELDALYHQAVKETATYTYRRPKSTTTPVQDNEQRTVKFTKPKPNVSPIKDNESRKVKYTKSKLNNSYMNDNDEQPAFVEEKREKFYYEYYLPDSLLSE